MNDWDFRFWIRRFFVLPLISVDFLHEAIEIIIAEMPIDDQKIIEFLNYFNSQWLIGKYSPRLWNHHRSDKRRTNNDLEGFHSSLNNSNLKMHSRVDDMIDFLKTQDCCTRDTYLKINNNQLKKNFPKKEIDKNLKIELCHEEFDRKEISFEEYFSKLTTFKLSPYESILENSDEVSFLIDQQITEPGEESISNNFKKEKLINYFKNINFFESLQAKLNTPVVKDLKNKSTIPNDNIFLSNQKTNQKEENQLKFKSKIGRPTGSKNKKNLKEEIIQSKKRRLNSNDSNLKNNSSESENNLESQQQFQEKKQQQFIQDNEPLNETNNFMLNENAWLSSSHIDHALDFIDSNFNQLFSDSRINFVRTWEVEKWVREKKLIHDDPNVDQIFILNANNNHWFVLTNINPINQLYFYDSYGQIVNRRWFMYDSTNNQLNSKAISPIFKIIYPDYPNYAVNMVEVVQQNGSNDCGLFALAFVYAIASKKDPKALKFDQLNMRYNYNLFIKSGFLFEFKSEEIKKDEKIYPLNVPIF
ncbi:unnamed protein product [Brachionus calyciflorus]|uniref:Ubiquitin-like protease family profile domain-containing protein n=1 Tax=Brachionus calyciflorus TaxID=104777 RepID=A0A814G886_9BILA|nr:unnamed protein product [Brachionus calyciflorus]